MKKSELRSLIRECILENADDEALYVEYVKDMPNETPFMVSGKKYQFVQAKYPSGKIDIGVYAFSEDLVYGYAVWKQRHNLEEGKVCSHCNGSGEGRHEKSKCPHCHGSGESGYKKPLTKRTDPDYDWDAEREERKLSGD